MSNHIVVGANFGDEGKGLVTNYLAKKLDNNIVIRFNGGAQAAHTVELDDNRRHVFHSLSSGTFQGSTTLLSEYFILNPNALLQELISLPAERPRVLVHNKAPLSVPFDWEINRAIEVKRGNKKHGSCGMGINETVTRMDKYPTFAEDLYNPKLLIEKLKKIQDEWVPERTKKLGIDSNIHINFDEYIEDCAFVAKFAIIPINSYNIIKTYDNRIFEGAQGLLLDEFHYFFPYVTRSRTGSHNAVQILKSIGEKEAKVHYVTRTYLTRHGVGPLPFENKSFAQEDKTNIFNKYQENLRFGPLNIDLMVESISTDLIQDFELKPEIMVTWGHISPDFKYTKYIGPGKNLSKILGMKQTWFYDKHGKYVEEKFS